MTEENWTVNVEHPKLADPVTKEAFVKAYSKYETQEDGLLGGLEAIKAVGKPFKLPESIDKLPSDEIKTDFINQVGKLMGVVGKVEDLADLNLTVGMAEGSKADETLANRFKNFVVDNKIPKSIGQKLIEFHNTLTAQARQKIEDDFKKAADTANEQLMKLYGAEGLKQNTELVRRMFQNDLGLSSEEFEGEAVKGLIDSGMTRNPVLCKALINAAKKLSKEGTTEGGGEPPSGGEKKSQYELNKERWPNSPELWGDPNK